MRNKNNIISDILLLDTLKTIATAYQEIAVMRMQNTRGGILHAHLFAQKLTTIYMSLRYSYPYLKNIASISHTTKDTARVLITANARFHGDILRQTFRFFMQDVDQQSDIILIGSVGKEYLAEQDSNAEFEYFDIPDSDFEYKHIVKLIQLLLTYKKVYVYYAQFKTVLTQEPTRSEIMSIDTLLTQEKERAKAEGNKKNVPRYAFEPSGEEIASFLNDTVTISLVRQSLFDSQLARHASRIKAMESLLGNVKEQSKVLDRTMRKMKTAEEQNKQMNRMTGMYGIINT
ncbi:MAG: F0F1 ATP synthase subunit gamma [bacterium]|nr:F0F1 ATP synthase subunit gamma [bacterium]